MAASDAAMAQRLAVVVPSRPAGVRRGDELEDVGSGRTLPTGFDALDAALPGGGWPAGALTELLAPQPALLEWRVLAPALAALARDGRSVVVVAPPAAPHMPGLAGLGIAPQRLVWVRAQAPAERLWAAEQLVRSGAAGAVVAWLPQVRAEQLRRLHLGAQGSGATLFACRPDAARHEASPAPLRLAARLADDGSLRARVVKRRGPPLQAELALGSLPPALAPLLQRRRAQPHLPAPAGGVRTADVVDALGRAAAAARSGRAALH